MFTLRKLFLICMVACMGFSTHLVFGQEITFSIVGRFDLMSGDDDALEIDGAKFTFEVSFLENELYQSMMIGGESVTFLNAQSATLTIIGASGASTGLSNGTFVAPESDAALLIYVITESENQPGVFNGTFAELVDGADELTSLSFAGIDLLMTGALLTDLNVTSEPTPATLIDDSQFEGEIPREGIEVFSGDPVGAGPLYASAPFILGDVNRDGSVDLLDIDPFIECASLAVPIYKAESDFDQDGIVTLLDVAPFVQAIVDGNR